MADDLRLLNENINPIFEEIRNLINTSRNRVYNTVNTEMINLYWKNYNGNSTRKRKS